VVELHVTKQLESTVLVDLEEVIVLKLSFSLLRLKRFSKVAAPVILAEEAEASQEATSSTQQTERVELHI
jgi:hypothetical protein